MSNQTRINSGSISNTRKVNAFNSSDMDLEAEIERILTLIRRQENDR